MGTTRREPLDTLPEAPETRAAPSAAEAVLRGGVPVPRDRAVTASTAVDTLW